MLIYFTSGTTSQPQLVEHTHRSYPVGHLSTMYFLGLRPGDVHLNISSPGWAKYAWSSYFAPWIAESAILVYNYTRFDASRFHTMLRQADVAGETNGLGTTVGDGLRACALVEWPRPRQSALRSGSNDSGPQRAQWDSETFRFGAGPQAVKTAERRAGHWWFARPSC
jgi:acetyl-CoA synthetase